MYLFERKERSFTVEPAYKNTLRTSYLIKTIKVLLDLNVYSNGKNDRLKLGIVYQ
jgi:hypothetical protein